MRSIDGVYKQVMLRLRTGIKSKHVSAFLHYNSPTKLRNLLRVEYAKRTGKTHDFGYPYVIGVEPTNRCNLQCVHCPTGKGLVGRKKQDVDLASYKRLIDEIGAYVYLANFQRWGETLLAQETPEMIRYAHDARIFTSVATNGNYATRMNPALVDAGLDHIAIAVDGSTQEIYETYRKNGRLDWVRRNITDLLEVREAAGARTPFVEMQFLVFNHNRHDVEPIRALAKELGVDGLMVRAAVAPENLQNRKRYYTWMNRKGFCPRFWYIAGFSVDGGVNPCCNFFYQEDDLGNAFEAGFEAAWNGDRYVRNREAVAKGDYDALDPICKGCKVYQGGVGLGSTEYGVGDRDERGRV